MSPIGGVGVNLAVQDAVAAANRLAAPLKAGTASDDDLRAIQARRTFPVRFTQALQLIMQKRIISPALASTQRPKPPLLFKLFGALPLLQRIPGGSLPSGCGQSTCTPPTSGRALRISGLTAPQARHFRGRFEPNSLNKFAVRDVRKSGNRFSDKIMLHRNVRA